MVEEKTPKHNFKMSEDKLVVPSKATKSALGKYEVNSKSCACFVFRYCGHFLHSYFWHTDYNIILLLSCIASDVWTQVFPYLRFLIVIKLSIQQNKSVKFPCVSKFLHPKTWLVILTWYDNAGAYNKIRNVAIVNIKCINKKYCLKYTLT